MLPPAPDRRLRALELIASWRGSGCPETLLQVHGFGPNEVADLVSTYLATVADERTISKGRVIEVRRVRLTAVGHIALKKARASARYRRQHDVAPKMV